MIIVQIKMAWVSKRKRKSCHLFGYNRSTLKIWCDEELWSQRLPRQIDWSDLRSQGISWQNSRMDLWSLVILDPDLRDPGPDHDLGSVPMSDLQISFFPFRTLKSDVNKFASSQRTYLDPTYLMSKESGSRPVWCFSRCLLARAFYLTAAINRYQSPATGFKLNICTICVRGGTRAQATRVLGNSK